MGGSDRVPFYARRGNMVMQEAVLSRLVEMAPTPGKTKFLRHWARIVDVKPDNSRLSNPTACAGYMSTAADALAVSSRVAIRLCTFWPTINATRSRPFDLARFTSGR
ncbi:MAG: hypothetical protein AB8B51_18070 [Sedimentitalea sp.]